VSAFSRLEVCQDNIARSAAMNMALDEVFWLRADIPRLRFYRWDHPALSFGYFGKYSDVACYRSERELVRRCTGGGIVFHGSDLTYALIVPAAELVPEGSPMLIYGIAHEAIKTVLCDVGVPATLVSQDFCRASVSDASQSKPSDTDGLQSLASECFANPVAADVLVDGQKVAGAAQRRSRRGLLQQGSIQNVDLRSDFGERFAHALATTVVEIDIDASILAEARQLARVKYQSEAWLRRR
jgi:lipoate-protein ligase A